MPPVRPPTQITIPGPLLDAFCRTDAFTKQQSSFIDSWQMLLALIACSHLMETGNLVHQLFSSQMFWIYLQTALFNCEKVSCTFAHFSPRHETGRQNRVRKTRATIEIAPTVPGKNSRTLTSGVFDETVFLRGSIWPPCVLQQTQFTSHWFLTLICIPFFLMISLEILMFSI